MSRKGVKYLDKELRLDEVIVKVPTVDRPAWFGLEPNGFSRWVNDTPRMISGMADDVNVTYWPAGGQKTVPNKLASAVAAMGATYIGPCN